MTALHTFLVAFIVSFIGTIPPGTLSLSIIQLGLSQRLGAAWRMSLAAAIVEYPYAWIAIEFQAYLSESVEFTNKFHLVSAVVMMSLGALSLWSLSRPGKFGQRFEASGFRRGVLLSILNPMAIPFWLAMTAYLKAYGWVDLHSEMEVHGYLLGVSAGALVLFMLLALLARKVVAYFSAGGLLKKIPGILLIMLGLYALSEYIFG